MWCEEIDNNNKEQKNEQIEFNKNIISFKNSESSENSKKYIENKSNKNNKKSKNISHLIQVQSWLFTYNNYFSRFHKLKRYLLCNYKILSILIKVLSKILQKKKHVRSFT